MGTPQIGLSPLAAFAKVAHYRLFCTSFPLTSWQPTSGLIPVSSASSCQTSPPLYPWYLCMRSILQLLPPQTQPRSPSLKHILFLSVVRDLNSTSTSVRAFVWGCGAIFLIPILWNSDKIKMLGIYIGNGDMDEANWQPHIQAVEVPPLMAFS